MCILLNSYYNNNTSECENNEGCMSTLVHAYVILTHQLTRHSMCESMIPRHSQGHLLLLNGIC